MVFGWGKKTHKDFGATLQVKCRNCNNQGFFYLHSIKTWFTVWWDIIPVIPYKVEYFLYCKRCLYGIELKDSQIIEEAKQLNKAKKISEAQYHTILNKTSTIDRAIQSQEMVRIEVK